MFIPHQGENSSSIARPNIRSQPLETAITEKSLNCSKRVELLAVSDLAFERRVLAIGKQRACVVENEGMSRRRPFALCRVHLNLGSLGNRCGFQRGNSDQLQYQG
jgi:hypothetical protein